MSSPNTLPVRHQVIQATWRLGESVDIPEPAIDCPILDEKSVAKNLFINGETVQLSLFKDMSDPTEARTIALDMQRREKEAIVGTIQGRANACADGTCPFIEGTEICFRRADNPLSQDETLFQPDLYGQQG